ncbi:trehalase-like domain-containing protein [Nocardia sp. NPDC058497]|uniref:trehalase-like domain-containing protein n=1 Tax=Nocardia sp. NPDC058497 TaxID=3346529 RepID=UPI003652B27D
MDEHGIVGDLQTAALVSAAGTIDWWCAPRFDSPSVFASLLDSEKGGHCSIAVDTTAAGTVRQLYLPDTAVLVTRFSGPDGVGEVADFMEPIEHTAPTDRHRLVRIVRVVRGSLTFTLGCRPRFDYGRATHTLDRADDRTAVFRSATADLHLQTTDPIPIHRVEETTSATSQPHAATNLHQWLAAGSAPIYVGFGSMDVGDPAEFVAMLRAVCARRGRRLLLASGWAAITPCIDAEVAVVDYVDHAEVLPRCVAAVHHGGAGTTAAALRAGVPQVICSVQADQPYWGQALQRLGLAATIPAGALTGARLDTLLDRISTPEVRRRATAYAAGFTTDGVERAVDAVETLAPVTPEPIDAAGRLP